ncbi:MAG: hypothetical protein KatS3mg077_1190 [Candidatus Binatia bacterium]|nr:MAG: hypothetical protein KatS3mg077_1190 [Candidatus Binatia bacterium]
MNPRPEPNKLPEGSSDFNDAIQRVCQAIAGLRYGEVRVVVHDGRVVQIERTEKLRLPK